MKISYEQIEKVIIDQETASILRGISTTIEEIMMDMYNCPDEVENLTKAIDNFLNCNLVEIKKGDR